jgi:hypothetical protein
VFGIRLLRLNADIVIAPAQTAVTPPALADTSVAPSPLATVRSPVPSRARHAPHGQALADAMRLIRESADGLDAARAERRQAATKPQERGLRRP